MKILVCLLLGHQWNLRFEELAELPDVWFERCDRCLYWRSNCVVM